MPRGIKGSGKLVAEKVENVVEEVAVAKQEPVSEEKKASGPTRVSLDQMRAMEAKAHLRDKPTAAEVLVVEADQQIFEAPDGTQLVGQKSDGRMWYRNLNGNGKGGWILPKR